MVVKKLPLLIIFILLIFSVSCGIQIESDIDATQEQVTNPVTNIRFTPTTSPTRTSKTTSAVNNTQEVISTTTTPTATTRPTSTITSTPTPTQFIFSIGNEITIYYLKDLEISGSEIKFEQELADRSNYHQHLVSYISEGNKIFGLLTIPFEDPPIDGYKAIVFNHGYIPPTAYKTTERYTAYVDYLARNGFVVLKIDYRGHGNSQGIPSGSYFSPGYTIDSISALKSLQTLEIIDPQSIGMWGHSMAGNLVLRAMLIEPDIKAGVIWAGAVYSYDDFSNFGIDDNTYRPPANTGNQGDSDPRRRSRQILETHGLPDPNSEYWKAVSLTHNIQWLTNPIQIHHAENDTVVNIGYSYNLAGVLQENSKSYEFYTYDGGGHNLISPYFEQAMMRTVEFFRKHL